MNIKNLIIIFSISTFTHNSFSSLTPDSHAATSSNSDIQDQHLLVNDNKNAENLNKSIDEVNMKILAKLLEYSCEDPQYLYEITEQKKNNNNVEFLNSGIDLIILHSNMLNENAEDYKKQYDSLREEISKDTTIKTLKRDLNWHKVKSYILIGSVFASYLISNQKVKKFISDKVVQTRKFIAYKFTK